MQSFFLLTRTSQEGRSLGVRREASPVTPPPPPPDETLIIMTEAFEQE